MIDREEDDKMMKALVLGSNSGDTDLNSLMDFVLSVQYYTMEETIAKLSDRLMPAPERTCHLEGTYWDDGQCTWGCQCSSCGERFEHTRGLTWNYCPHCGAKVVEQ